MRRETALGGCAALALGLLVLASCGGHSSPDASPPAQSTSSPSTVFIADAGNLAIGSLINPNPAPGTYPFDRIVTGPPTALGTPGGAPSETRLPGVAIDSVGDRLYVAKQDSILVFDKVSTASGNVPPSRVIQTAVSNHAVNFFGLYLTSNDVLYAVEATGEVRVFNNASARQGSVTPDRTIVPQVSGTINSAFGVAVDTTRDILYVGIFSTLSSILVFTNAAAANATLPPDRQLDFALRAGSFFLDPGNDMLYASLDDGVILAFDGVSGRQTGTPVPNRLMTLPVVKQLFITVDTAKNRLYAVNGSTLFIVNGASTADDPMLSATRVTISSASSLFSAVAARPLTP